MISRSVLKYLLYLERQYEPVSWIFLVFKEGSDNHGYIQADGIYFMISRLLYLERQYAFKQMVFEAGMHLYLSSLFTLYHCLNVAGREVLKWYAFISISIVYRFYFVLLSEWLGAREVKQDLGLSVLKNGNVF